LLAWGVSACGSDDPAEAPRDLTDAADATETAQGDALTADTSDPDAADTASADADTSDPDAADTASADADTSDPDAADTTHPTDPPDPHPARYPTDRTLSPLTPYVAQRLREVAARDAKRQPQVFAKVGDSVTVNVNFMACFDGPNVNLGPYDSLQATLDWFGAGDALGVSPFSRVSLAAQVGWSAQAALAGSPSPLSQELSAILPRFAVVMFGTNDVQAANIDAYANHMLDLTDALLEQGVIPALTTIMPRGDDPAADARVPAYNLAVRAIAQARQVPLIDLHRALAPLPDLGLGADRLHPSVYRAGQACAFAPAEALAAGYNIRNLITLQTLDRLRRVVLDGEPSPDAPEPSPIQGDGSPQSPFIIDRLPFTDARDTSLSPHRTIDTYTGCNATQNESGPEYFYRLEVTQPITLTARLFDRGDTDIDIHLLGATPTADACIARNHLTITRALQPGTYHLSLDTFTSGATERSGEYLLILSAE
jgi:lysophospholipase L1-like esterase